MSNQVEDVKNWQATRNLDKMPYRHRDEVTNVLEELLETFSLKREDVQSIVEGIYASNPQEASDVEKVDAYFDICVYSIGAMMKLGFDPAKVFAEGLREINDRTGAYDPQVGKWVKQTKQEGAHKANFKLARL